MSLALLHDVVRAQVQNSADKGTRKSLRKLTVTERQAVRGVQRQMRARRNPGSAPDGVNPWWM
jgi:hypothetical protein